MAKEEKPQQESQEEKPQADSAEKKPSAFGLFTWLILSAVVFAGLIGGFALAQLIAAPAAPAAQADEQKTSEDQTFEDLYTQTPDNEKMWNYDLDAAVGNLDEPGVSRHVRISITFQMIAQMDQEKGMVFLDEKKPLINDYLAAYVAGLTLERVRGTANMNRIKKELRDGFNELLFPDSKPFIARVLLREFAVN